MQAFGGLAAREEPRRKPTGPVPGVPAATSGQYSGPNGECALADAQFTDKFIAYYDVCGWKEHVKAAEGGGGLSLGELLDALRSAEGSQSRDALREYGPTKCPEAPRLRRDLDFRVTQASDSVLVSAEVSPAGLINRNHPA